MCITFFFLNFPLFHTLLSAGSTTTGARLNLALAAFDSSEGAVAPGLGLDRRELKETRLRFETRSKLNSTVCHHWAEDLPCLQLRPSLTCASLLLQDF